VVVDSAVSVVVGTVEASVVSVAEEVGGAVALADLVAGSVDSAAEGSGGRSTDKLDEEKVSPQRRRREKKTHHEGGHEVHEARKLTTKAQKVFNQKYPNPSCASPSSW
jgi:hypothetical protein